MGTNVEHINTDKKRELTLFGSGQSYRDLYRPTFGFVRTRHLQGPLVRNLGLTLGKYLTWDMLALVKKNATVSSSDCPTALADPFQNFHLPW